MAVTINMEFTDEQWSLIKEHFKETQSKIAKNIIEDFNNEIKRFVQVCPKEMLDKLSNPISIKKKFSKAI